jgi:hypothetical protein
LEEHVASIFRIEEKVEQETSKKQAANRAGLPPAVSLVSGLAFSSILKLEATCPSETSVDFERNTRRYIPEERTLQRKCFYLKDNLRGNPVFLFRKLNGGT